MKDKEIESNKKVTFKSDEKVLNKGKEKRRDELVQNT